MCVDLVTGELDRLVTLELILSNGTADTRDFNSSNLVYIFAIGSVSGSPVCNNVSINSDVVVENREYFEIELQADPDDSAVDIARNSAMIFIDDSSTDCKSMIKVRGALCSMECMITVRLNLSIVFH